MQVRDLSTNGDTYWWSLSKTGYDVMLHSYKDSEALQQGLLPGNGGRFE